ncbi:MAG: hypothetical protein M0D57_00540 [Sphingobacteriales bacterium JAD_PAG50586_3]|nr:MAG: hypothetical protein M0D57_00540 [Sphingobacteriales bacterium JAD_PAG50586_3]
MEAKQNKYSPLLTGILIGSVYGFICRLVFESWLQESGLATITFMFFVPTVLGIVPLVFATNNQLRSFSRVIAVPFLTIITAFLMMALTEIEGIICFLIMGVPFFVVAWLAALAYRAHRLNKESNKGDKKVLSLLLVPFLIAPLEQAIHTPSQIYKVKSEVVIDAPAAFIWQNIIRVDKIKDEEYTPGVFNYLGIPRPIQAELDGEGLGASVPDLLKVGCFLMRW